MEIDQANAEFWDNLCSTSLARQLGIIDRSPASLYHFDYNYLALYPYLLKQVPIANFRHKRILEVGLGFGTLGQKIVEAGANYLGLDIAVKPVQNMNARLKINKLPGQAIQGNILDCPAENETFDAVVAIGCFHHTGNLQRCIDETYRVLKPGGSAFFMVYNRYSFRQWYLWPKQTILRLIEEYIFCHTSLQTIEEEKSIYDGEAVPETVFTSVRELKRMTSRFQTVQIKKENCDGFIRKGREVISRKRLLPYIGPLLGLDLYVTAVKSAVNPIRRQIQDIQHMEDAPLRCADF